jgi:peptidoglycan hydrolase-like protein with peptidoglycan-binding domain
MDYRIVFPTFPRPPSDYDQRYFQDIARALDALVVAVRTAGEGRQTTIVLTDLKTNDVGLESGTMFQVDGVLRVSMPNLPYVAGNFATGRVGTVSVTTV